MYKLSDIADDSVVEETASCGIYPVSTCSDLYESLSSKIGKSVYVNGSIRANKWCPKDKVWKALRAIKANDGSFSLVFDVNGNPHFSADDYNKGNMSTFIKYGIEETAWNKAGRAVKCYYM